MLLNLSLTTKTSIVHDNGFVNRKIKKLQKNFAWDFKESSLYIFHVNLVKEIAKDMQIKYDTNTLIINSSRTSVRLGT